MLFDKFRELIVDPFKVKFDRTEIKRIENYPHAGNDVIECSGFVDKKPAEFFIKFERHQDADFENEAYFLEKLQTHDIKIPKVIEFGNSGDTKYLVLEKMPGARISFLMELYNRNIHQYCNEFGYSIGKIHAIPFVERPVKERRFHNLVQINHEDPFITTINNWLSTNKPKQTNSSFIHGDHHYANILWQDNHISGVLDWELAGSGNKEFDLAWAIVLRPSQKFFSTRNEEEEILNGYCRINNFDHKAYSYYKVQVMSHFHAFANNEPEYTEWLRRQITGIIE